MGNLTPPPGPFNLGNTAYLGQETTQERQALYGQLVNSYKWTDKVQVVLLLGFVLIQLIFRFVNTVLLLVIYSKQILLIKHTRHSAQQNGEKHKQVITMSLQSELFN